jgi:hypothetical protein
LYIDIEMNSESESEDESHDDEFNPDESDIEEEEEKDQEYSKEQEKPETPYFNKSFMNQLTLDLMVNKKHFKKVLEKTDSTKLEEMNRHSSEVKRASSKILAMTENLLKSYIKFGEADNYNEDIKNIFDHYVRACLDHIIQTERNKNDENYIYHKETDVIFENLNEKSTYVPTNVKNSWGKAIMKTY